MYGLAQPGRRSVPAALAGSVAAIAAMAASDLPATVLSVTDPTTWKPIDWAADLIPHLAYGLAHRARLRRAGRPVRVSALGHQAALRSAIEVTGSSCLRLIRGVVTAL
jgi:hypothetical protein